MKLILIVTLLCQVLSFQNISVKSIENTIWAVKKIINTDRIKKPYFLHERMSPNEVSYIVSDFKNDNVINFVRDTTSQINKETEILSYRFLQYKILFRNKKAYFWTKNLNYFYQCYYTLKDNKIILKSLQNDTVSIVKIKIYDNHMTLMYYEDTDLDIFKTFHILKAEKKISNDFDLNFLAKSKRLKKFKFDYPMWPLDLFDAD